MKTSYVNCKENVKKLTSIFQNREGRITLALDPYNFLGKCCVDFFVHSEKLLIFNILNIVLTHPQIKKLMISSHFFIWTKVNFERNKNLPTLSLPWFCNPPLLKEFCTTNLFKKLTFKFKPVGHFVK